jgi:hypothetical protein
MVLTCLGMIGEHWSVRDEMHLLDGSILLLIWITLLHGVYIQDTEVIIDGENLALIDGVIKWSMRFACWSWRHMSFRFLHAEIPWVLLFIDTLFFDDGTSFYYQVFTLLLQPLFLISMLVGWAVLCIWTLKRKFVDWLLFLPWECLIAIFSLLIGLMIGVFIISLQILLSWGFRTTT